MKIRKFVATLIACITLLMSVVGFLNKSYAKLRSNAGTHYLCPDTPYEHNAMYLLDVYTENSSFKDEKINIQYNVSDKMITEKKAILASYRTVDSKVLASLAAEHLHQKAVYKGSETTADIKKIFTEALSCKESDITIQNIFKFPAIKEDGVDIKEKESVIITSETDLEIAKKLFEKMANNNLEIAKELNDGAIGDIEKSIEKLKGDNNDKETFNVLTFCNLNLFETRVIVENAGEHSGIYSLVVSPGSTEYQVSYYYVYRDDLEEKPNFATSLDYESIEGTEVKKKATSAEENPFLPYYTDNDNNKKDTDAIAYIRSKTDEKIVSVDGVELKTDGRENEKGWYYPDITNQKVVAKKYLFDTYNNKNDNGKVNEKVEVVGENGGKSQENPNIEWTFRRKIKEEEAKSDGSKVITITFNLPIDESRVEEGWSTIRDDDGAVRKITRTFENNEGYDKEVPTYQNGTGKEVKTPVKLTAPVISKTGETTFLIVSLIVIASAVVVVAKRKIK